MAQYDGSIRIDTKIETSGLRKLEKSLNRISSAAKKFAGIIASAFAIGKLVQFGKEMLELGSDLEEVQNVVDVTFTTMSKKVNEFAKNAAVSAGLSETMAKKYVGTFGAMAKSFGFAEEEAYNMSTALTQLSGDVASFYNISQDEAFVKLKSVFTGETETLKDLGVVMTQAALDQYALANGFGKTTSAMTEAEKVGLRYQFVMQQLSTASGDFIRTADGWANQVRILKLQFESLKATIGQGLINVFTPVVKMINILLGKLATLANAFKSFTELITGGKAKSGSSIGISKKEGEDIGAGYGAAAGGAEDLAKANKDAAKSAGKAAKAAKGQLSVLDKLNNLSSQSASGSGGGGGAGGGGGGGGISAGDVDYGGLAEGETIADKLSESLSAVWGVFKQAWENKGQEVINSAKLALGNLRSAATSVGTTFYEVFTNGTGLDWLESSLSLLKSILDIIGSIAGAFSTAWNGGSGIEFVTSIFTMLTNVNNLLASICDSFARVFSSEVGVAIWENILGIITGVNNIIGNLANSIQTAWDTAGLGDSIWQGVLTIFNTILETIHGIADSTAEWAANLDFTPLLTSIDGLLKALQPLTKNIGDGLKWFWDNVLLPIAGWAIEDAVPAFLDMLSAAITALNSVIETFKPLGEWLWDSLLVPLGNWAGNTIISEMETLTDLYAKFGDWVTEHKDIVEKLAITIGSLAAAFGIVAAAVTAWNIVAGIASGVAMALGAAITFLSSPIGFIALAIAGLIAIGVLLYKNWDTIVASAKKLGQKIAAKWKEIKDKTKEAWENVKSKVSETWEKVKASVKVGAETAKAKVKSTWDSIKSKTASSWDSVKTKVSTVWTALKTSASTVFSAIKTKVVGVWNSIKTKTSEIWNGIKNAIKKPINAIIGFINSMISGIVSGINALTGSLNKFKIDIPEGFPVIGGKTLGFDIPQIKAPQIPALATGTVVPPNREFLAVLGDNKREPEVVSPLSTIEQAVTNAMSKNGGTGGVKEITLKVPVQIDGRTLFEIIRKIDLEEYRRTGRPSFQF